MYNPECKVWYLFFLCRRMGSLKKNKYLKFGIYFQSTEGSKFKVGGTNVSPCISCGFLHFSVIFLCLSFRKQPFNSIEVLDTSDGDGSWTMSPSMVSISGSVKAIAVQTGQKIHREATVHSEPLIKFEQAARPPHKRPRMF